MNDYFYTLIKDIIENNDKEEAIKIIANKLNEKQISNEKEILTNLDKDKEIERLNNIIEKLDNYVIADQMFEFGNTREEAEQYLQELKGSE